MVRFEAPPTEPQCLCERLAKDVSGALNDLRTITEALEIGPLDESVREALAAKALIQADKARAMQFDIQRLRMLVDGQTDTLRGLFTKTIHMVDDLRASAAIDGGWSESLENATAHVGSLQQAICAEFPGEEFPGGD